MCRLSFCRSILPPLPPAARCCCRATCRLPLLAPTAATARVADRYCTPHAAHVLPLRADFDRLFWIRILRFAAFSRIPRLPFAVRVCYLDARLRARTPFTVTVHHAFCAFAVRTAPRCATRIVLVPPRHLDLRRCRSPYTVTLRGLDLACLRCVVCVALRDRSLRWVRVAGTVPCCCVYRLHFAHDRCAIVALRSLRRVVPLRWLRCCVRVRVDVCVDGDV